VVAVKTGDGAAVASFRSVGLGSASHCGEEHDSEGAALDYFRLVGVVPASHSNFGLDR
jgi:hypothetical protein